MPRLRECEKCHLPLPESEFRPLRGRPKRLSGICELCELEAQSRKIRQRRQQFRQAEQERLRAQRPVAGND